MAQEDYPLIKADIGKGLPLIKGDIGRDLPLIKGDIGRDLPLIKGDTGRGPHLVKGDSERGHPEEERNVMSTTVTHETGGESHTHLERRIVIDVTCLLVAGVVVREMPRLLKGLGLRRRRSVLGPAGPRETDL